MGVRVTLEDVGLVQRTISGPSQFVAPAATTSSSGLMSTTDKTVLQSLTAVSYSVFTSGTPSLVPDALCIISGSVTAATLPDASIWSGKSIVVKKRGVAADIIITPSGSQTIDGAATYTLVGSRASVTFTSDGSLIDAFPPE